MYDFLLCAKDIDSDSVSTIVLLDLGTVFCCSFFKFHI